LCPLLSFLWSERVRFLKLNYRRAFQNFSYVWCSIIVFQQSTSIDYSWLSGLLMATHSSIINVTGTCLLTK
jgi:hypothetical protein